MKCALSIRVLCAPFLGVNIRSWGKRAISYQQFAEVAATGEVDRVGFSPSYVLHSPSPAVFIGLSASLYFSYPSIGPQVILE